MDDKSATRPEWSSFCEEERRVKKRERRAEFVAIIILINNTFQTL